MAINTLPEGYILNNEYKLLQVLGQGGFGITYLAEDVNLGHRVVIKEFLPQSMAVRDQNHYTIMPYDQGDSLYDHLLRRFVEEAKLLASIRHPNIVKVTRLLEANSTAYFIMDYAEGETLEDYLQRHPTLSEQDILSIMMPILEGTKYVHAQGVLHRDIAPDNIYLKTNGMPMLIDFGAARNAIAQQSQVLSAITKEGYSPPEQHTSNADQNASTDIYALGAVMYRMITGKKPTNATQRQMALLKGERDPIRDIIDTYQSNYSKALLQAVVNALEVQQEQRPQSIEAFQRAIAGKIKPVPPKRKDRSRGNTTADKNKGYTGLIIGIIILLLALGGMIGYMVLNPQLAPPIVEPDSHSGASKKIQDKIKQAEQKLAEIEKKQKKAAQQNLNLIDSYTAKIGYKDHYNSHGTRLTKYSEILRQDRANYHKFYKRDSQDESDRYFSTKENRGVLERMVRRSSISYSVRNAIESGNPLIKVRIYKDGHLEIDLQ